MAAFIIVASYATYFIVSNAEGNGYLGYGIYSSKNKKTSNTGEGSGTNSAGSQNKKTTSGSNSSNGQNSTTGGGTNGLSSGGAESDVFSIAVAFYGDSQSDTDEEDLYHLNAVNCILSSGVNSVFHVGDLMEDGTEASLDRFNNVTATLQSSRTFFAALGNNDRVVGDPSTPSPLWFANFSFPNNEQWYSVNYGNLHLVVLDSAFSSGSMSQLSWLTADLQSVAS